MHRRQTLLLLCVVSIILAWTEAGLSAYPSNAHARRQSNSTIPPVGTAPANVSPVLTSTPSADGTVVHVVEYGQTLYAIAVAYGVTVEQIKALNNLTSNDIFVGNKLIIKLGNTATATGLPTPTPTRTPRPTRTATKMPPTRIPTKTPTVLDETQVASTQTALLPKTGSVLTRLDPMLLAIAGLAVIGIGMMIAGSLLKKKL